MNKEIDIKELLKPAKELIGSAEFDGDALDVFESLVKTNSDKSLASIVGQVKKDKFLSKELKELGMSDSELKGLIKEQLRIIEVM